MGEPIKIYQIPALKVQVLHRIELCSCKIWIYVVIYNNIPKRKVMLILPGNIAGHSYWVKGGLLHWIFSISQPFVVKFKECQLVQFVNMTENWFFLKYVQLGRWTSVRIEVETKSLEGTAWKPFLPPHRPSLTPKIAGNLSGSDVKKQLEGIFFTCWKSKSLASLQ